MTRSKVHFLALTCSVVLALAACKSGDDDDSGNTGTGGTGATATGTGGMAATGTGGTTTAGTGGMSGGAAGMGSGAAPNMPNAMCLATTMMMPCDQCACTPSAMGGCLDELTTCATDMSAATAGTACKALIDCAGKNNCNGNSCLMPCMAEISAASMAGNALTNAMAVGACTSTKCMAVCAH